MADYTGLSPEESYGWGWYGTGIDIEDSKQKELLRVAEKRTLEMIADGASLSDVLNDLCAAIDERGQPSHDVFTSGRFDWGVSACS
jgi:hypothetical protein